MKEDEKFLSSMQRLTRQKYLRDCQNNENNDEDGERWLLEEIFLEKLQADSKFVKVVLSGKTF